MLCELCGQPASGLRRVKAEGVPVLACPACVRAGPLEVVPAKARPVLDTPPLKENYGEVVRKAREARKWTTLQLANEAKIKEGLLKKIERNEIAPEEPVRKRLEHVLKVSLLDEVE